MVMSKSKLYVEELTKISRYSLDNNGGATQDSFSLPSSNSSDLELLRDTNGDDTVLYRYTGKGVEGHRVGPALAEPEEVAGSPRPIEFPVGVGVVLHPNKRFLIVASQGGLSDSRARLQCLEIDPVTGAILGQRGEIVKNDVHFTFPMVMTGEGLLVVQFPSGLEAITIGSDGSLSSSVIVGPSSGRLLAAAPSGNFIFELGGTGPELELRTYQVSSSGATLTDIDLTPANIGMFLAPAP